MASVSYSGVSAEALKFDTLARGADDACRAAVKAGAKVLAQRLADKAPRDTGALAQSIKPAAVTYDAGDGYSSKVAPVGESHGQNLAMIGNVLEYGRSNMEPRPWFFSTVAAAESEVNAAMKTAFDSATKGGGGV